MQPWTQWFREKQESIGTIEEFAQASGIKIRTVSSYRAGSIPRRSEQLKKIAAIFGGDTGPLPGSDQVLGIEARFAALEAKIVDLELRLAAVEPSTSPGAGDAHLGTRRRRVAEVVEAAVQKAATPPHVEGLPDTGEPARAQPRARRSTG